jgi:hypothetical protein
MLARKTILGAVAVCVVGLLLASQSLSQPGQPRRRTGDQGPPRQGPGGRQFDPERMRQMMEQRLREQLGATEQEWKVLGPCVMEVSQLRRELSGFGRGGMFGGGMFGRGRRGPEDDRPEGDRPGGRRGAPDREQTELEKALDGLRTLLEDTSAKPADVKNQLTVVRATREKTRQKLAASQQKLRAIVTMRQEAQLVLWGMLD